MSLLLLSTGCSWAGKEKATKPPDSTATDGNVRGRVWFRSDVQSIPDSPFAQALVIAFREDRFALLRSELGQPPARFLISEEMLARFAAKEAGSDSAGAYSLQIPPGNYWVCVGDPPREQKFPVYVYGCLRITVPQNQGRERDLFVEGWGRVTEAP